MRLFLLFVLLVQLFLLSSCKKYNAADSSFFVIPKTISVATTPLQGTGSHKITDLWVYVNGKFQGVYPVGNLIPIPNKQKKATINVFAGIKNNGIADTRIFYPFFDLLKIEDTLVEAGKSIERDFTFKYKPNTTFTWTENFDSGVGFSIKKDGDEVFDTISGKDAFENKSLKIILPDTGIYARVKSSSSGFYLPTGTGNVYLELNYKCNTAFTIGLTDDIQSFPAITLNPQETWNKTYIQLSTVIGLLNASKNKVYFQFFKNEKNEEETYVILDNIKLIYL